MSSLYVRLLYYYSRLSLYELYMDMICKRSYRLIHYYLA